MLSSGDVVDLDVPEGREAGFRHPSVLVTAQRILDAEPAIVHVVPLTSTRRNFASEVTIEPDDRNGLELVSEAQCQHIRAVSASRIQAARGNVGTTTIRQIREVLGLMLDIE